MVPSRRRFPAVTAGMIQYLPRQRRGNRRSCSSVDTALMVVRSIAIRELVGAAVDGHTVWNARGGGMAHMEDGDVVVSAAAGEIAPSTLQGRQGLPTGGTELLLDVDNRLFIENLITRRAPNRPAVALAGGSETREKIIQLGYDIIMAHGCEDRSMGGGVSFEYDEECFSKFKRTGTQNEKETKNSNEEMLKILQFTPTCAQISFLLLLAASVWQSVRHTLKCGDAREEWLNQFLIGRQFVLLAKDHTGWIRQPISDQQGGGFNYRFVFRKHPRSLIGCSTCSFRQSKISFIHCLIPDPKF